MRIALWFLGLFGVAVALALFASGNDSTITVFWSPYRVDLSLNLVVLLLLVLFALMHLAFKALSALLSLPGQARLWRIAHQERAMHTALLDAMLHLVAGRFIRARKAAELVLAREASMARSGEVWADAPRLRVLVHLLAAESSQSLQDKTAREIHLQQALAESEQVNGAREAVLLRAMRWALQDRDAEAALDWLDRLPSGVARRTVALRLRLKVARLAGNVGLALETTRLLAKHRAFSPVQAQGLLRALAVEYLQTMHDPARLETLWRTLDPIEKAIPEVACVAADRLVRLGGSTELAFEWLLPTWERMVSAPDALRADQKKTLIRIVESCFSTPQGEVGAPWLARIEQAQRADPGDAALQYLAGVACLHLQLWGKAQQLLGQALPRLEDGELKARAWQVLAELAQRQGDEAQAAQAWKNAAQIKLQRD